MMRSLNYFGLVRPYRLERVFVLFAGAGLLILLVLFAGVLALQHDLGPRSLRGWYFVYVGLLLAVAMAAVGWPRVAASLLALAAFELGFGAGSTAFKSAGLFQETLMPPNTEWSSSIPVLQWHPLLQVAPTATPGRLYPSFKYVHDSQGLRGEERDPRSLQGKTVVALFGGSTTFGLFLPQEETWAKRLEQRLGAERYAVLNHGVDGYTTAENLVQTAFYQDAYGIKPACAIYYEGWNDLRNNFVANLDRGYADFHLPSQIDAQRVRRLGRQTRGVSPTLNFVLLFANRLVVLAIDTARPPATPTGALRTDLDPAFVAIYLRNVRTISDINRARGVRTLWIGQHMNKWGLTGDKPYGWLPLVADKDIWPLTAKLNDALRAEAIRLGDVYVDVPIDIFDATDFFDQGHFTISGSVKFTDAITATVSAHCR